MPSDTKVMSTARPKLVAMVRRSPESLRKNIDNGRVSPFQSKADQAALERQERQLLFKSHQPTLTTKFLQRGIGGAVLFYMGWNLAGALDKLGRDHQKLTRFADQIPFVEMVTLMALLNQEQLEGLWMENPKPICGSQKPATKLLKCQTQLEALTR